jgi:hypothetical protein
MADARCPTCKKTIIGGPRGVPMGPHRPFCSVRCRVIDLGSWLDAAYRISAPVTEEDLDEGMPDGARASADDDEAKN